MQENEFPQQSQKRQPGLEYEMHPRPVYDDESRGKGDKLAGKVALITGGDSGIGRAVSVAFAKEGADVFVVYLEEHDDAQHCRQAVEHYGGQCILFSGDIGDESVCKAAVKACTEHYGHLDILVNNAAEQHVRESLEDINPEGLQRIFSTNVFAMFYLVKAAYPYLRNGGSVINTTSVTAYEGNPWLLDYSTTKGAITAFTRALSSRLLEDGIRVNAVAPGPIWTPLIPASFSGEHVARFGTNKPLGRAGQPVEVAPSYVFLASNDASYMSGQVLHPNGGEVVNG